MVRGFIGRSCFFLISNKYALIKGKPKYTGSEQGKETTKKSYKSLGNQ